jgi:hypothetical protein
MGYIYIKRSSFFLKKGGLMKKLLLISLFATVYLSSDIFFFTIPLFAQEVNAVDTAWVRRYNGPGNGVDNARAIATDDSGYIYVTGESWDGTTARDYATVKYKPNGDTVWVRRYNGPTNGDDYATAIAVNDSFYVYVSGRSPGSGSAEDYLTIKYKPIGDTAWVRRYNGPGNLDDGAYALAVDGSGNVYVTGYSYGSGTDYDYATLKYLPNGDTAWVRRYNGPGNLADYAEALGVDDSGNVYVTGASEGSGGTGYDYATLRYLPNGDTAWVRRYNGPGSSSDGALALVVDGSGNIYVTGYSTGGVTGYDYATLKYLPTGDTAWVRRYNGPGSSSDEAFALAADGSGNVYLTGRSGGSGTSMDYATIKYYPNGDTAWVRRYNGLGNGWDESHAITLDFDGYVYVTGMSVGNGTTYDYATVKYDSSGNEIWIQRYNGPGNNVDGANAIALLSYSSIYVTGGSDGSGTNGDYATLKYAEYVCGDANGDLIVNVADLLYLFSYCFKNGQSPAIIEVSGDADGYSSTTIRDIAYLGRFVFYAGDFPNCNRVGEYVPVLEPADTISFSPAILFANDSTIAVSLNYKNSDSITAFAFPIKVTIGGSIPIIDSVKISSRISDFELKAATIDTASGTINIGFVNFLSGNLSPGSGTILTLYLSVEPESFDRQIEIDTVRLSPYNSPLFIKAATLEGIVPIYSPQQRNDTLRITAYSPVDLIVTDPSDDSIGIDFNTIPGATYDTTNDQDKITIPNPLIGEYSIKVKSEPDADTGHYSITVKLDGNEDRPLAQNLPIPPPDQIDTITYTVIEYLRGDANSDYKTTVSDVVFLINYLFRAGPAPDPVYLGDVNCDDKVSVSDVVWLINYLFKGGPAPCS